ncbi:carbohydrate ABC transporter permease [Leifsonia sp. YAF41]|uniref:carbohydrate ABC transporter permease n=1 Tax=Leifsonia sp. YAF41 TaxID=3233086 RepID=UPI003F98EFFD
MTPAPLSGGTPRRPRRSSTSLDRSRVMGSGLFLLLPVVILEVALFFVPLVYIFFRSTYDWQPGGESTFIGIDNYTALFADPEFWEVVGNQLFYLLGLPLWVISPLIVAYLLRENVAKAGLFRSIYFLPAVMSPAIVGLVFRSLLSGDGPVNSFLNNIGLGEFALPWLTDAALVKPVIIVLVLWAGFGTGVLIFSSAFAAVPQSQFEAARLDGAGFWREFWYIAIPNIRSTIVLWTMFQVISIFLFMFAWIYVLTGGGPGLASTTMDYAIYQNFMRFGYFGTAAAQSVVLVVMILVVASLTVVIPALVKFVTGRLHPGAAAGVGATAIVSETDIAVTPQPVLVADRTAELADIAAGDAS